MFFILSKLFLVLLSPLSWLLISIFFAFRSKKSACQKRGRFAVVFIALFFSNNFIYKEFCRQWEVFGVPIEKVGTYDVAIVLGGMTEYNNDLKTLSIRRGGDRIWQAITLYKTGHAKKILISGDHGYVFDKGLHEAIQLKSLLVSWGIPKKNILTESISKNTYENAVESKKVLAQNGLLNKKMLLITSGRHMKRAAACFDHAGLKCDAFSTDLYTGPKRSYSLEEFIVPDVSTFSDWHGLNKEVVGYVTYGITNKL